MAMNGFSVEVDELKSEAAAMREATDRAKEEIDELMQTMEALNAQWSGPSKDTFRAVFRKDYLEAMQGREQLVARIEKIEEAERRYRSCEEMVRQKVQQL